ncbi:MAG: malto-oligosyltrehalose trehalohydrolase [Steroidobacteraceae bacterium]
MTQFGASYHDGVATFRLLAPSRREAQLLVDGAAPVTMRRAADGWFTHTALISPGARYRYLLDGVDRVPDPASRFQPDDVHGPSELVDPATYAWQNAGWRGRPWHEAVVYELHVGCFSPQGNYRGVIDKLEHLAKLGVTAIELMPLADFPGRHNWGYDGVLPYAPESAYGRPDDLRALVDAAHGHGLMVLLDVVYNHFGPEGNYASAYWPTLLTQRHETPWGAAINYDDAGSAQVREFFIDNALYWLEEFRFDGLRLDAVHAIRDDSGSHFLDELAARVAEHCAGREIHLLLENEENDAARLAPTGPYRAQWNDDVHHGLHVAVTREAQGYYADYCADPTRLPRALAEGFAWQGEVMNYRGAPRGTPSGQLPPTAFVAFLQNHDQIGNRAFGERLTSLAELPALRAASAIYLLAPQIPMLFMGEEWGTRTPFQFFCDLSLDLREAVRDGRRAEFAHFAQFQDAQLRAHIPDPTVESTFAASRLDWSELARPEHAAWLAWYRRILAVRRDDITPLLPRIGGHAGTWTASRNAFVVRWKCGAQVLALAANLSPAMEVFPSLPGRLLWSEGATAAEGGVFEGWSLRWTLQE